MHRRCFSKLFFVFLSSVSPFNLIVIFDIPEFSILDWWQWLHLKAVTPWYLIQATRCFVLVSHGASIWDVKNLPCENMHNPSLSCVAKGCSGGLSFATCSADGTIRIWDLALQSTSSMDKFSLYTVDSSLINHPSGTTCLGNFHVLEIPTELVKSLYANKTH